MSLKTSLRFGEELEFSNGKLHAKSPNIESGRIVGELTIDEYDAYGRKLFSSTEYNDITLPGSIFVLEKMFGKEPSNTYSFPSQENQATVSASNTNNDKIFGFVVGKDGEDKDGGGNIIAPSYATREFTFLPFIKSETSSIDNDKYYYKKDDYYYIKGLTLVNDPIAEWADGTGDVKSNELGKFNIPILAYISCELNINNKDLREYFGTDLSQCYINQLGLVAGTPNGDDYTNYRLVTMVNFKTRDLSNNENTIKIKYKIYCL